MFIGAPRLGEQRAKKHIDGIRVCCAAENHQPFCCPLSSGNKSRPNFRMVFSWDDHGTSFFFPPCYVGWVILFMSDHDCCVVIHIKAKEVPCGKYFI
jgi:hypothetical protein